MYIFFFFTKKNYIILKHFGQLLWGKNPPSIMFVLFGHVLQRSTLWVACFGNVFTALLSSDMTCPTSIREAPHLGEGKRFKEIFEVDEYLF